MDVTDHCKSWKKSCFLLSSRPYGFQSWPDHLERNKPLSPAGIWPSNYNAYSVPNHNDIICSWLGFPSETGCQAGSVVLYVRFILFLHVDNRTYKNHHKPTRNAARRITWILLQQTNQKHSYQGKAILGFQLWTPWWWHRTRQNM
jgi:hypothetical protein